MLLNKGNTNFIIKHIHVFGAVMNTLYQQALLDRFFM